jgi:hypothetical protein
MDTRSAVKLALAGFAIAVALSVALDPRTWRASHGEWWAGMTPLRRRLVIAALGASLAQSLL